MWPWYEYLFVLLFVSPLIQFCNESGWRYSMCYSTSKHHIKQVDIKSPSQTDSFEWFRLCTVRLSSNSKEKKKYMSEIELWVISQLRGIKLKLIMDQLMFTLLHKRWSPSGFHTLQHAEQNRQIMHLSSSYYRSYRSLYLIPQMCHITLHNWKVA